MSSMTPQWKRGPLRQVMQVVFGSNNAGGPDTRAAATQLGVSQRTVQRWLAGRANTYPHMSEQHWAALCELARPTPEVMGNEAGELNYAKRALEGINRRRHRNVLPAWKNQGFLEPHMVVIYDHAEHGFRQVTAAKVTSRNFTEVHRRGTVLEQRVVANKFEATVLTHELLKAVDRWRFVAPAHLVSQGRTWTWLRDGKSPTLAELAVTNGLR